MRSQWGETVSTIPLAFTGVSLQAINSPFLRPLRHLSIPRNQTHQDPSRYSNFAPILLRRHRTSAQLSDWTDAPILESLGRHGRRTTIQRSRHRLVGYPRCSTTWTVVIGVVKYKSTALSSLGTEHTIILSFSLQENVHSLLLESAFILGRGGRKHDRMLGERGVLDGLPPPVGHAVRRVLPRGAAGERRDLGPGGRRSIRRLSEDACDHTWVRDIVDCGFRPPCS